MTRSACPRSSSSASTTPAAARWPRRCSSARPQAGCGSSRRAASRPTSSIRLLSGDGGGRDRHLGRAARRSSRDGMVRESDVVITMGCGDACPIYPGKRYEDWDLEDPAGKDLETVRGIRDEISDRVAGLVEYSRRHRRRGLSVNGDSPAPAPARRVPRLRLPRRRGDRLGDRGRAALPRRRRPAAVRERGGDGGGPVHDHPHVRPGLGRPLQPGRLARRRELRRPPLARRARLHPGPGAPAASPARSPRTRCSRWRRSASRPTTAPRRRICSPRWSRPSACSW